ncbi:MAG TPA: DUF2568 domain-containing protein [Microbacteriaceae bacterium]|nr:DUF2568 domain-containing protein [Microbacteriaceae bacterium]
MTSAAPTRARAVLEVVRALTALAATFALGAWGVVRFALPFPGLLVAAGAVVGAVLVWALFLSPRSVVRVDVFGRALVEIGLSTAGALALLGTGAAWWAALALIAVTAIAGVFGGRADLADR